MKTNHARSQNLFYALVLVAAPLVLATFTACSKDERNKLADQAGQAAHETQAAIAQTWSDVKAYTFDKRDEFQRQAKAQQAELEARLSELRATYAEDKASASRRAAMEELRNSEADYRAKLAALGTATADTWDAARDELAAAWHRVQSAYAKARAD
ncbi:hypothetical protein [Oleiharenicola sp. Vm1]|uniref:hypothetical protein n=1 Tax=Oleiharenicola sp. Vm1 TaxID=3398393 RepID=UPI0039F58C21